MDHTPDHIKRFLQSDNKEYAEFKRALEIFGDKWSAVILLCLFQKSQRFVDIQRFAEGISPRTLTQRLHSLEEFGLITRQEFKEFPPRTEYTLTQKAHDLRAALVELKKWAKKYCKSVDKKHD